MKNTNISKFTFILFIVVVMAFSAIDVYAYQKFSLHLTIDFGSEVTIEGESTNSIEIDSEPVYYHEIGENGEAETKNISVHVYFTGDNTDGWYLNLDVTYDTKLKHQVTSYKIKNRDMSEASANSNKTITWESTGPFKFGTLTVTGDKPITSTPTLTHTVTFDANGGTGTPTSVQPPETASSSLHSSPHRQENLSSDGRSIKTLPQRSICRERSSPSQPRPPFCTLSGLTTAHPPAAAPGRASIPARKRQASRDSQRHRTV